MNDDTKPSFLSGSSSTSSGSSGEQSQGHNIQSDPKAGNTAPAGEFFGADNPVENSPFPGTMSRG